MSSLIVLPRMLLLVTTVQQEMCMSSWVLYMPCVYGLMSCWNST